MMGLILVGKVEKEKWDRMRCKIMTTKRESGWLRINSSMVSKHDGWIEESYGRIKKWRDASSLFSNRNLKRAVPSWEDLQGIVTMGWTTTGPSFKSWA
jgi:hypothetical protein